jgi:predicted Rossmann fold flavoprotein
MHEWNVIVVGAGAAGLLAAAQAAQLGLKTLLVEKNRKPGVKILMSGGTRCNLTQNTDTRGIITAYGKPGKFLHSALARLNPKQVVELFESEGVLTKIESTGKIFPASDRALDVQQALLRRLERCGATLALDEPVISISRLSSAGFDIVTSKRTLTTDLLLLTTGGKSYPGCGTTGDGYAWASAFGHTIVPPRPALVPLTSAAEWLKELSGITLPEVFVAVHDPEIAGKASRLAERHGSLLFTHFGLSGPVALDVSRAVSGHTKPSRLKLVCDFLPHVKFESLLETLRSACQQDGKKQILNVLQLVAELLPRRVLETCLQQVKVDAAHRAAELGKDAQRRIVESLKQLSIPLTGTLGFEKAEVTAGGVALAEVDSSTMQSKLVPGLYLAGEILDLDGPIGGYNFQAAFSTGILAAESMAAAL